MVLPMLYYLADVIAFLNVVVVGTTPHHMYGLIMADVTARWKMCNRMEWVHPNMTGNTRFPLYLNTKYSFVCLSKYVVYIHQSSFINVHTVKKMSMLYY